jgi:hypothetical protein
VSPPSSTFPETLGNGAFEQASTVLTATGDSKPSNPNPFEYHFDFEQLLDRLNSYVASQIETVPEESDVPLEETSANSASATSIRALDWTRYITIHPGRFIGGGVSGDVYEGTWGNIPEELSHLARPRVVVKQFRVPRDWFTSHGDAQRTRKKVSSLKALEPGGWLIDMRVFISGPTRNICMACLEA